MARFWCKLLLIVFATGIVQEFQFGMNWSTYSRYVGDVFGAPLAMEGLAAFFVESTFPGMWIFRRDRLSPRVRLFCIWMVAIGTSCPRTSSSPRTRGCSIPWVTCSIPRRDARSSRRSGRS
jgi:cytochrome bd ubiquinol oxidase subunit I